MKEEKQPQHTQGEWKIDKLNRMSIIDNSEDVFNQLICQVNGKSRDEADANAQRIVKAVNMHDELVEALELALSNLTSGTIATRELLQNILKQASQK